MLLHTFEMIYDFVTYIKILHVIILAGLILMIEFALKIFSYLIKNFCFTQYFETILVNFMCILL